MVITMLTSICACQQHRLDIAKGKAKDAQSQLDCYKSFVAIQLRKHIGGLHRGKVNSKQS